MKLTNVYRVIVEYVACYMYQSLNYNSIIIIIINVCM